MDEEEIKKLFESDLDPNEIEYLRWLLNGDCYCSSAEQNSALY